MYSFIEKGKKMILQYYKPVLKTAGLILGVIFAIPFFFSWIAILLGALYYFCFQGKWRQCGFVLALSAALATNAPLRGFDEITGIYPLFLVVYVVLGTFACYFLLLIVDRLLKPYPKYQHLKLKLNAKIAAITASRPHRWTVCVAIFLIPVFLWTSVNIDLAVIFDNKPQMLWVNVPSTVSVGEEFSFQVQCWDRFERLSALYNGTVSFSLESYSEATCERLENVEATCRLHTPLPDPSSLPIWLICLKTEKTTAGASLLPG